MPIRNFLKLQPSLEPCHEGQGMVKITTIFNAQDFTTALQFMHFTVLPPGTSIGLHTHGDDEEIYVILEGSGVMEVDGQKTAVSPGDVILNRPFGTHALYNLSNREALKILVFEASNQVD